MTRRSWEDLDLEVFSEEQLKETCLRLEGRVRMLRSFLADLHRENATLRRQRAMLSDRLGEMEDSLCAAAAAASGDDGEELLEQSPDGELSYWALGPLQHAEGGDCIDWGGAGPRQQRLLAVQRLSESSAEAKTQELELRRCQAQEEQLRMEVCEHQLSRAQMEQDSADRLQRLTAREELELRRCQAQEEQLRVEVCEHQLSRAQMEQDSADRLQRLTAREELELRRCQEQEGQLRVEVCEHQLSRAQMEQDLELRRCQAREEEEEVLQMEAGMVQPSDVRGFFEGTDWAREHSPMSSEQKILLGPPSAHTASVTFTRAPEPSKAEARSERSERSDSHTSQQSQPSRPNPSRLLAVLSHSSSPRGLSSARSPASPTYPRGAARSPVFAYHTHIQQKVPFAEVAWQRRSSLELQLPPPPRSFPARDSELRPADLKLTVLTSDSRLETLMFREGNFEQQALEFLMQKKLKAAFVGGLAAKMKAMVAAGQAQSSVDIVDLI